MAVGVDVAVEVAVGVGVKVGPPLIISTLEYPCDISVLGKRETDMLVTRLSTSGTIGVNGIETST